MTTKRTTAKERPALEAHCRALLAAKKRGDRLSERERAKPLEGEELDLPYLRKTLAALVRRVELDPATRQTRVLYMVGVQMGQSGRPHGDSNHAL